MKAWVLHGIGDFRLETVEEPILKENEVLVAVKAVGICGSDIPRVYQTGTYSYPLIPGHEFSGVVAKTGMCVDTKWQGQRVGIFPLIPCKKCVPCQRKQYEMCRNYSYLGSRRNGGFAEYAAVPVDNLIKLPDSVSFEEAAMMEPMAVAVHSIRRIPSVLSDKIVICGLGTIGLLVLMFLQEKRKQDIQNSMKILVIGNKEWQKQSVLKLGLPEKDYCDSSLQNVDEWLMERTDYMGVDCFFECVGKNETLIQAVNHTAPGGTIMLIGNPYSDMSLERNVYWKILRNQLTILGTWNSSFTHEMKDDWHYVLERLEKKKVTPAELITHHLSLEELEYGFHIIRDKVKDYGKIIGYI